MGEGEGACRFGVLGTLDVTDDSGHSVPLRSQLRRRLLAIFLAQPFEDIPADRLIDQLWYDDPPLGRGALHIQVSRLRKDLASAGAVSPVVTVPNGYRFQIQQESIDWVRFVRQVERARDLVDADPQAGAAAYLGALELWRGAAFEDTVGCPLVDDQARYLDAFRRSTILASASLLGRLGNHSAVVDLLAPVHGEEPFDESVSSLLARSFCLGGQVDRALAVVDRTVDALQEEFRAKPSAAFVQLAEDLRTRPGKVVVESAPAAPARVAPPLALALPLPASRGPLIGRAQEREELISAVQGADGPMLVEIVGPSGYGKSSLALAIGHHLREDGWAVRFGVCATSAAMVGNGIRSMFADVLRASPLPVFGAGDQATAAEIASVLAVAVIDGMDEAGAEGCVVLVVDDLGLADTVDRLALEAILRVSGRGWFPVVLATSRSSLTMHRVPDCSIELGPVSVSEIDAALGDPVLAAAVHGASSGDPLTVGHAVARLVSLAPADRAAAFDALVADPGRFGLRYSAQLSRCSTGAQEVLAGLAAAGTPLALSSLQGLLEIGDEALAIALVDLIDEGLAIERTDGTVTVAHDILGSVFRAGLGEPFVEAVHERLFALSTAADPWVPAPVSDTHVSEGRRRDLLSAVRHAMDAGAYDQALALGEMLLGLDPDDFQRLELSLALGTSLIWVGRNEESQAHFQEAYELAGRLGDEPSVVDAVRGFLGAWNAGAGPTPEQATFMDDALAGVQSAGPRAHLLARAISLHLGFDPRCQDWAGEAMALAEQERDPIAVAVTTSAFSNATLGLSGAERRFRLTRRIVHTAPGDLGFDHLAGLVSHHFVASCEVGELDEALWCVERHRLIGEHTGRPLHQWRAHVLEASALMLCREPEAASAAIDAAADISRRHRLTDGRMTELLQRAVLSLWTGEFDPIETGYRGIGQVAPHVLAHALDAAMLHETDEERATLALASAVEGLGSLRRDYLFWAAIAATANAAKVHEDEAALAAARDAWRGADVRSAVLAVGTANLPMDPLLG